MSVSAQQVQWVSELRPKLLQRAVELVGDQATAEDYVQESLLAWWDGSPRARTRDQLLHFLRTV